MTRSFNISNPRLDFDDYPDVLYRIHLDTSHTLYDSNNGFECPTRRRIEICNYNQLAEELSDHLNWYSGQDTCFISMFGDESHAIQWARKALRKRKARTAHIMEIDPSEIRNAHGALLPILQVGEIISQYPDLLPDGTQESYFHDEFLALYKIPEEAIMNIRRVYL
ncbi:hypothetical protein TWF281_006458 [Arthrobotrys megalospora]